MRMKPVNMGVLQTLSLGALALFSAATAQQLQAGSVEIELPVVEDVSTSRTTLQGAERELLQVWLQ